MNSSLKTGAISGFAAGIVWGIAGVLTIIGTLNAGLPAWSLKLPLSASAALIMIIFSIIFGIIYGMIFSKIYDLIPGKGVSKGLLFGLGIYLILWIRNALFMFAYGWLSVATSCLLSIDPIILGLILGILYKAPPPKLKTEKYDMKSGIIPGAITGLISTIVIVIGFITTAYFGMILQFMETYPKYLSDIGFIINQYGAHALVNMIMMACYGAFYSIFYDRIPGKAVLKGGVFGFVIWLLTDLYNAVFNLAYESLGAALFAGLTVPDLYIGSGILLEGLYKGRLRAFPIAAAIFLFSIIKYFALSIWLGTQ